MTHRVADELISRLVEAGVGVFTELSVTGWVGWSTLYLELQIPLVMWVL